jgi:glycosyltransferase involved in cell wall biosynthesis
VHAAGELMWHHRENAPAARCETPQRRLAARTALQGHAARHRRDVRRARRVIALSSVFAGHLDSDENVPWDRISVLPDPIDLHRFAPVADPSANGEPEPAAVLFVSRISARKGVDLVVALSRRLADLVVSARIHVTGDRTLGSDYRALINGLNPNIASHEGPMAAERPVNAYAHDDLVNEPSQYEPFALTVGEALTSGLPAVASGEVGANEGVEPGCCTVFRARNRDAFEAATRAVIARIESRAKPAMVRCTRAEAQRLFFVDCVADGVVTSLKTAFAVPDSG